MTDEGKGRRRDPLGKRALFSGAGEEPSGRRDDPRPGERPDLYVHCSSCDARTPMSVPGFLVQHLPLWAWLPWRRHPHLMRCPACGRFTWLAVS